MIFSPYELNGVPLRKVSFTIFASGVIHVTSIFKSPVLISCETFALAAFSKFLLSLIKYISYLLVNMSFCSG